MSVRRVFAAWWGWIKSAPQRQDSPNQSRVERGYEGTGVSLMYTSFTSLCSHVRRIRRAHARDVDSRSDSRRAGLEGVVARASVGEEGIA